MDKAATPAQRPTDRQLGALETKLRALQSDLRALRSGNEQQQQRIEELEYEKQEREQEMHLMERTIVPELEGVPPVHETYLDCLLKINWFALQWVLPSFGAVVALSDIIGHPRIVVQKIFFIYFDQLFNYGLLCLLTLVARYVTSITSSKVFCYAFIALSFINNITYVFTGASATNGVAILTSTLVTATTGVVVVPSTKDIYTVMTKKKENDEKCCTWMKNLCEGGVRLGTEGPAYESMHSDELVSRILLQGHVCTKAATPFTVNKVLEKRKHCRPDIGDTMNVSQLRNTFWCLLPDEAVAVAQKCGKGDAVLCTK